VQITAIVVNYHTAALCRRAVRSVLGQDGVDARVMVVDNSEDAGEAAALGELAGDRVRLVINDRNAGFGAACRQAWAADGAPLVLLLNPDAWLLPGALARLAGFLQGNERAGAVSPRAYLDDECEVLLPPSELPRPRDEIADALTDPFAALVNWRSLRQRRSTLARLMAHAPMRMACLSGAHVLLRRAAVEASGGLFDPRFFMYYEDSDLCRRLHAAGWHLYTEPAARAVHHYDQSEPAGTASKLAMGAAAAREYMAKYDRTGLVGACARGLRRLLPAPAGLACEPLGGLGQPPAFDVPAGMRDGWALEISRHPQLRPAAVRFGAGARAAIPDSAWRVLRPATYFCRLGAVARGPVLPPWTFERLPAVGA